MTDDRSRPDTRRSRFSISLDEDDEATNVAQRGQLDLAALRDVDPDSTTVSPQTIAPEVDDAREEATALQATDGPGWQQRDTLDQENEQEAAGKGGHAMLEMSVDDEATGITDQADLAFMHEQAMRGDTDNTHLPSGRVDTEEVTEAADLPTAAAIASAMLEHTTDSTTDVGSPPKAPAGSGQPVSTISSQIRNGAKAAFGAIPTHQGHGSAGATEDDELVGTVLLQRYEVTRRIGMGGMSTVYLGRHTTIGKEVAIKVLSPQLAEWPVYVERFLQEARAASMISHPNVVDITDFGYTDTEDRLPFFVMEYLPGEDLRDRLGRMSLMTWLQARPIVLQICSALEGAHRKGVVHRDIKPENCFVIQQEDGTELVKLLDFGIAKVASDTEPGSLTAHGVVLGTVDYISPERANKEQVDARADIYSLGVLLFRMVAGQTPFQGDPVDIVTAHVYRKPPRPTRVAPDADIAPELEAAIMRTLAKNPDQRFQSVAELSQALLAVPVPSMVSMPNIYADQRPPSVSGVPISAAPGLSEQLQGMQARQSMHMYPGYPQPRSNRVILVVLSIVVALLIVIVLLLASESDEEPAEAPGKTPASGQDSGLVDAAATPPQP